MPLYEATLSDGRVVTVEGDREPTAEDIQKALAQGAPAPPTARPAPAPTATGLPTAPGDLETSVPKLWLRGMAESAQKPFVGLPRAEWPKHPYLAAAWNVGKTVPEFFESPLGVGSLLLGGLGPAARGLMAAGFGAQMTAQVPEAARQAGAASVVGTPQQKAEAYGALGLTAAVPGALAYRYSTRLLPRTTAEALKTKGVSDASQDKTTAEVYGPMRPQPTEGPGQVPPERGGAGVRPQAPPVAKEVQVSLRPEHQALLDNAAEREAIDHPIEVVSELPKGEPFGNRVSTIDRATGRILINPQLFGEWLADVPEARRDLAVRSLLSEEAIHLRTKLADALNYWRTLTRPEQMIESRRYTGRWRGVPDVSEQTLAYEAIRFRLQQLARMTPREIAEAPGFSRLGMQSLTVLENAIRGVREAMGTKPSRTALAILDRMEANLDTVRAAAGAEPGAYRKRAPIEVESPDGTKYRATFDGWWPDWGFGSITTEDAIPGVSPPRNTTTVENLLARGFRIPEQLHEAAYQQPDGRVETGPNHPQILRRLGIQGFETPESRNTPEFGFSTTRRPFVSREQAGPIAEAAGQDLKDFEPGEPVHSDEVSEVPGGQVPISEGAPGTYAKRRKAGPQAAFYLPPLEPGEVREPVEVPQFVGPRASEVEAQAKILLDRAKRTGKAPSFEDFHRQIGKDVPREALFYPFQEALLADLMNAPGKRLTQMVKDLGLGRQIAEALHPGEREPKLGSIADALDLTQREFVELGTDIRQSPRLAQYWRKYGMQPQQRARAASIGEVLSVLMAEAGEKPTKPWSRAQIGPEDIDQGFAVAGPQRRAGVAVEGRVPAAKPSPEDLLAGKRAAPEVITSRRVTTIPLEARDNPKVIGDMATADAALEATGKGAPPRTVTKNVIALKERLSGKVALVSAWRDPRQGPKVIDPSIGGKGIVIGPNLLKSWEPMTILHLRPEAAVQQFRQIFGSQAEFDEWFGTAGIEGTPGLRGRWLGGPQEGIPRKPTPLAAGLGERPEVLPPSPTGRELSMRSRVPPTVVREGPFPARQPAPEPSVARPGVPTPPELLPEAPAPPEEAPRRYPWDVIARGGRMPAPEEQWITLAGRGGVWRHPWPQGQPGRFVRAAPQRGQYRAYGYSFGAQYEPSTARYPGVHSKASIKRSLNDEAQALNDTFQASLAAGATRDLIRRAYDDASNRPHNQARQVENSIRLASTARPPGLRGYVQQWQRGNPRVLAAANAMVQAGVIREDGSVSPGSVVRMQQFQNLVEMGRVKAQALIDGNREDLLRLGMSADEAAKAGTWRGRRIGQIWLRAADQLKSELDYAQAHWEDTDLQETARRMKFQLEGIWRQLHEAGIDVRHYENYLPGRYDLSAWNGHQVWFRMPRVWGTKWREPKPFPDYYTAIAVGPYVAATRDGASLVGHAVRSGLGMIAKQGWEEGLKELKTSDNRPLAIETTRVSGGRDISPDPRYVSTNVGGRSLAVDEDFAPLIRRLTGRSVIEDWAPSRAALHMEQIIKHNLLLGDFFHLGRVAYYGASILGRDIGWRGGWTAIDFAEKDLPEAVRRGVVTQEAANWATEKIPFGRDMISRAELLRRATQGAVGFNIGRIQDALYKDLHTRLTPVSGPIETAYARMVDPTTGRYNRFLFDKLTRGYMAEAFVNEFERQSKAKPGTERLALMRDVSRDVNNYFGNLGRQGLFDAKWQMDLARLIFLAPQWVEGLARKELVAASRLTGLSAVTGQRQGLTGLGTTGYGIGRGLLFMFGLTQLLNLMSKHHTTFQNEEKGHKFDAWIPPLPWIGNKEGFWFSPLAVYAELAHDLWRLSEGKPKFADTMDQIVGNKEAPITRAALIGLGYQTPPSGYPTTTLAQWGAAAKAAVPIPLTFGRYGQAALHAMAPGAVAAPPAGSMQRQLFATAGIKIEPARGALGEIGRAAHDFMRREGLEKTTGWKMIQTDEPSYSKMRGALRDGDERAAARIYQHLLAGGRTPERVIKSMRIWATRPFTGSKIAEAAFRDSLGERGLETYVQAQEERMRQYSDFAEFWLRQHP
jgi:hypothetical protein